MRTQSTLEINAGCCFFIERLFGDCIAHFAFAIAHTARDKDWDSVWLVGGWCLGALGQQRKVLSAEDNNNRKMMESIRGRYKEKGQQPGLTSGPAKE